MTSGEGTGKGLLDDVESVAKAVNTGRAGCGGGVAGAPQSPLHADGPRSHVHQHSRDEVGAEPAAPSLHLRGPSSI